MLLYNTSPRRTSIHLLAFTILAFGMSSPSVLASQFLAQNDVLKITLNDSADGADWLFRGTDACYSERFGVWTRAWGQTYTKTALSLTSEFGDSANGDTATYARQDVQVTWRVEVPEGDQSRFYMHFDLHNAGSASIEDVRFFYAVDYDISDSSGDYGWYSAASDYVWQNDDNHFKNGFSGSRPSSQHGMEGYSTNNIDMNDGTLNGNDSYPNFGTNDVGVSMGWEIGTLGAGEHWDLTLTFVFGEAAGIEAHAGSDLYSGVGQAVQFDGSASTSVGTITTYEWDLDGDGTFESTGVSPTWTYSEQGETVVTLRVRDDGSREDTDELIVRIIPNVDLILEGARREPAGALTDGMSVVVRATVRNGGEDNLAESFNVRFTVDGNYLDSRTVSGLAAGETRDIQTTWRARGGEHILGVIVAPDQSVHETDYTNNEYAFDAVTITTPDYQITSLSVDPTSGLTDGLPVRVSATVRNQGPGDTVGTSRVTFYVDGDYVDSVTVSPGLATGEETTVSGSWTAVTGTHTLTAECDSGNALTEADESNNRSEPLTLPEVLSPDLQVTEILFSPDVLVDGVDTLLRATINNTGTGGTARTFYVRFEVDGTFVAERIVNVHLDAGASTSAQVSWKARGGDHVVRAIADQARSSWEGNQISESNEENNSRDLTLPSIPKCDLTVEQLAWSPAQPVAGDHVRFSVTLKNVSQARTLRDIPVQFSVDGQPIATEWYGGGMDAGGSAEIQGQWNAVGGVHTVRVTVDPDGVFDESAETNNQVETTLLNITSPELQISALDWSPKTGVQAGDSIRIGFTVENLGSPFTREFHVGLEVDGQTIGQRKVVGGVRPGQPASGTFTWSVPAGVSTALRAIADFGDSIGEENEENNTRDVALNLDISAPDYRISELTFAPESGLSPGDAVLLRATVANDGPGSYSGPTQVGFFLGDAPIGTGDALVEGLAVGQSQTITATWLAQSGADQQLTAIADYTDLLVEPDELNNRRTVSLGGAIPFADLRVTGLTYTPNQDVADRDSVTIGVAVTNDGPADVVKPFQVTVQMDSHYYRTAGIAKLEAGQTVSVNVNWIATPGDTHQAVATVDSGEAIPESNEENNALSEAIPFPVAPMQAFALRFDGASERTGALGGETAYRLRLSNHGSASGDYAITVTGLPERWATVEPDRFDLAAGENGDMTLHVTLPTDGLTTAEYSFQVSAQSIETSEQRSTEGLLRVETTPIAHNLKPEDGAQLGSDTVVITWETLAPTTSLVRYRASNETEWLTAEGETGLQHAVALRDLERNRAYIFETESTANTGTTSTAPRTFTVTNGVAFTKAQYPFTVEKDYNQKVSIAIRNSDTQTRPVAIRLDPPPDDLIVAFVGEGSMDRPLTLRPGETRQMTLAIHLQDARETDYSLNAYLESRTADSVLTDRAAIALKIHVPNIAFDVQEIETNPVNLSSKYRLTNLGDTVTDLQVGFTDDSKSNFYFDPEIDHMRLESEQTLEFWMIPILATPDFQAKIAKAKVLREKGKLAANPPDLGGKMRIRAGGREFLQQISVSIPVGQAVHRVNMRNLILTRKIKSWFCTNKPNIEASFTLPQGFNENEVVEDPVYMDFAPPENAQPHSLYVSLNGYELGSIQDAVPRGRNRFDVNPSFMSYPEVGVARNTISVHTVHVNEGHYLVSTDFTVVLNIGNYTTYVVAESQSQAEQIATDNLPAGLAATPDSITVTGPTVGKVGGTEAGEVRVGQSVRLEVSSQPGLTVTASFSNGDGSFTLGERGSGQYVGHWYVSNPGASGTGACTITFKAKGTGNSGTTTQSVTIIAANELYVDIDEPLKGFVVGKNEEVGIVVRVTDQMNKEVTGAAVSVEGAATLLTDQGPRSTALSFTANGGGIYLANWVPSATGEATIKVTAQDHSGLGLEPATAQVSGEVVAEILAIQAVKEGYVESEPVHVALRGNESVSGVVKDALTNEPIIAGKVRVVGRGGSVITGPDGRYTMRFGNGTDGVIPVDFTLEPDAGVDLEAEHEELFAPDLSQAPDEEYYSTTLTATVEDTAGNGLPNQKVEFTLEPDLGTLSTAQVTDENGLVEVTYTAPAYTRLGGEEEVTVKVTASLLDSEEEDSIELTLYPPQKLKLKIAKAGFKDADSIDLNLGFADGVVTGQVLVADYPELFLMANQPIEYVQAQILGDDPFETDPNGYFEIVVGNGGDAEYELEEPLRLWPDLTEVKKKKNLISQIEHGLGYKEDGAKAYLYAYETEYLIEHEHETVDESDIQALKRLSHAEAYIKHFEGYQSDALKSAANTTRDIANYIFGKINLGNKILSWVGSGVSGKVLANEKARKLVNLIHKSTGEFFSTSKTRFVSLITESDVWRQLATSKYWTHIRDIIWPLYYNLLDLSSDLMDKHLADATVGKIRATGGEFADFSKPIHSAMMYGFHQRRAQELLDEVAERSENHAFTGDAKTAIALGKDIHTWSTGAFTAHINTQGQLESARAVSSALNDTYGIAKYILFPIYPILQGMDTATEVSTVALDGSILANALFHAVIIKAGMVQSVKATYGDVHPARSKIAPPDAPVYTKARATKQSQRTATAVEEFNTLLSQAETLLQNGDDPGLIELIDQLEPAEDAIAAENRAFQTVVMSGAQAIIENDSSFGALYETYFAAAQEANQDRYAFYFRLLSYLSSSLAAEEQKAVLLAALPGYRDNQTGLAESMATLLSYLGGVDVGIPGELVVTGYNVLTDTVQAGTPFDFRLRVRNTGGESMTNVQVGISPDESLTVIGDTTQTVETLEGDTEALLTWTVQLDDANPGGYSVVMTRMLAGEYVQDKSVLLPTIETDPPVVEPVFPAPDSTIAAARPQIETRISDGGGSGLDWPSLVLSIDGNVFLGNEVEDSLVGAFDPETSLLSYTPESDLTAGAHQIRIQASDLDGNPVDKSWGFTVAPDTGLQLTVDGVSFSPFSPNGDGFDDETSVRFTLSEPAQVTAVVLQNITPVRTLLLSSTVPAGRNAIAWDGRDDNGEIVAAGNYRVAVVAQAGETPLSGEASVSVSVGALTITGIEQSTYAVPVGGDDVLIRCTLSRDARIELQVYEGTDTTVTSKRIARDEQSKISGPAILDWDLRDDDGIPVTAGIYTFALVANDGTEAVRLDNMGGVQVTSEAAALPDLVVYSAWIELETGADCDFTSTDLGLRVVYANVGAGDAGAFTIDANGMQKRIDGLTGGQSAEVWFADFAYGTHNTVTIDTANEVRESDETNNVLSEMLPIPTLPPTCTPTASPTLPGEVPTGIEWILAVGDQPSSRNYQAMTYDSARERVVLFGGKTANASLNDTWEWDGDDWSRVHNGGPSARSDCAMAYDAARGNSVLFGGEEGESETLSGETWTWDGRNWHMAATDGPTPLSGCAMAYDSVRERVVLFGGWNNETGLSSETWEWNGSSWARLSTEGPPSRYGCAMAYDAARNQTLLYGGWSGSADLGDTWAWDGTSWEQVAEFGPIPRSFSAMAYDASREGIVLFGGWGAERYEDTWRWDGTEWNLETFTAPTARNSHAMAYDTAHEQLVLFGGGDSTDIFGDTWVLDRYEWREANSGRPSPREGAALINDAAREEVLLFGGWDGSRTQNDTYTWDGSTWNRLSVSGPEGRTQAGVSYDSSRNLSLVFGGWSGTEELNDTWAWDGAAWTRVATGGPEARYGCRMVYDALHDRVVLFGGWSGGSTFGDTWTWDGTAWSQASTSGPEGRVFSNMAYDASRKKVVLHGGWSGSEDLDDTWEWDGAAWTHISTGGPEARSAAGMAYDPVRDRVFLFGGWGAVRFDDTWSWDGATWELITREGPEARNSHAMVYDTARRQFALFGGFSDSVGHFGDTWVNRVYEEPTHTPTPTPTDTFTPTPTPSPTLAPVEVDLGNLIEQPVGSFASPIYVGMGSVPVSVENPEATDGQGLQVILERGQGALLLAGGPVEAGSTLMELSAFAHASSNEVALALVAIALPVDGSLGFVNPSISEIPVDRWGPMRLVYHSPSTQVYPALQVVVPEGASSGTFTVYMDSFTVGAYETSARMQMNTTEDSTFDTLDPALTAIRPNLIIPEGALAGRVSATDGLDGQGVRLQLTPDQTASNVTLFTVPPTSPRMVQGTVWARRGGEDDGNGFAMLVITDGEQSVGCFIKTSRLGTDSFSQLGVGGNFEVVGKALPPLPVLQIGGPGVTGNVIMDELEMFTTD